MHRQCGTPEPNKARLHHSTIELLCQHSIFDIYPSANTFQPTPSLRCKKWTDRLIRVDSSSLTTTAHQLAPFVKSTVEATLHPRRCVHGLPLACASCQSATMAWLQVAHVHSRRNACAAALDVIIWALVRQCLRCKFQASIFWLYCSSRYVYQVVRRVDAALWYVLRSTAPRSNHPPDSA